MRNIGTGVLLFVVAGTTWADDLDYSVGSYAPATIKVAGDGTIFVDYANPVAGATYSFTMFVWVESGKAATPFPTVACPVEFMRLSGVDATGWFVAAPNQVSFTGYGLDPIPKTPSPDYTGTPGGSFQAVLVSLTIPASGLGADLVQVKVKARTKGIKFLGEGHGVIVRFSNTQTLTIQSWLSDSNWVPLSDPAYNNAFQVVTRASSLNVVATNPGSFYYNVLVTTLAPIADLRITVDPLPQDFVLWGANATHAWVGEVDVTDPNKETSIALGHSLEYEVTNVPANTVVFLTVHVQYALKTLPSTTYLPRVYTFSAGGTDGAFAARTSASMTGVRKK